MSTISEKRMQRELLDTVAEEYPQLWQRLYPRRYQTPATYDTPKAAAHAMVDAIFAFIHVAHQQKEGESPRTEQVEAQWAAHLARHGVPTYYLTYDLADALMKTRPTMVDWMKMKLPFDSAVFMLPKGIFPHNGEGSDVSFVSYSRNFAGDEIDIPLPWPQQQKWTLEHRNAGFTVIVRISNGATIHWTLSEKNSTIEFSKELEQLINDAPMHGGIAEIKMDSIDHDVQKRGVILLFNILLFMTAKPEMVETGELLKRVAKKREQPVEYWSPHFIGRTYRMRRLGKQEYQGGHHASPRGHWVSGYWREQAYGPKFTLRRTLWIDPFWKGGEELN